MGKLRVHNFAISLDGFGAGPRQDLEHPLGKGGHALHGWVFDTAYGRSMIGASNGSTGLDDRMLRRGDENIGATIMGRNMFGPIRGPWDSDESARTWRGWWGETPPYHHDVFVLTHHAREPLAMDGGTTFHFVTEGPLVALERATQAASGADIRLGGGVGAVRDYVERGLVDSLHLAVVPVILGSGERIFENDWNAAGYRCSEFEASEEVVHVQLVRES
ncbi:dihydrofolate reductase family protein [Paeniglutamicibacter sp. R2-26]|uniref:dihydrofolate reductase family protein n=1 Tax=Paeniglutamicibacter sp. R2-26 TaxID=3144417 RepID=UPI003EE51FF3